MAVNNDIRVASDFLIGSANNSSIFYKYVVVFVCVCVCISLLVLLIMSYTYGTYNRCIPYRITEDINDEDQSSSSDNSENKIQVLMVSSPDRDDRVFPKVGI